MLTDKEMEVVDDIAGLQEVVRGLVQSGATPTGLCHNSRLLRECIATAAGNINKLREMVTFRQARPKVPEDL